ncbi:aldehyde dehydrogenase family protein [Amycolatopsis sp. MtRt-6]|uniref:aldehyde dehydrogenase family protein n=1 Tax=Amycolatopsis sp. MtRt-6 TaxID=2792782 RepID=UPI001A8D0573|nr:aldehyde dehydrogenase family protein [Amycolatopsis sp. MtRt-6]
MGTVIRNPYTGERLATIAEYRADQVADEIAALTAEPPSPRDRAAVLSVAAGMVRRRRTEFSDLITAESGVCRKETLREVDRAAGNLEVAAAEAERLTGEAIPLSGAVGKLAVTIAEPAGVVGAITPFNRPLNQVVVKLAPALAAGNRVILKPSEKTPLTALLFVRLLEEAGLPDGTVAVVTGEPETVGGAIAASPLVDMVTFTGGPRAGRAVALAAAGKPVLLELGGNDPLVVFADADPATAAALAVDGAFATAGQSCRGVKRVLAQAGIADELVARIVERAKTKRFGDPGDPETDVGPVISEEAAARVTRRVEDAVGKGAKLLHGGGRQGTLVEPTVLDDVPADAELVVEETFGPVAPVIRFDDPDEAIALANSTGYGLQAGVLTHDVDLFLRVARQLRVGTVNLADGPHFDSPHIPFGGVKGSGIGREGIRFAMRAMTVTKTLTMPYRFGAAGKG